MGDVQIVFDIGGTNSRVAVVQDGTLASVSKVKTPKDPEVGVTELARLARGIAEGQAVSAVCAGYASTVVDGTPYRPTNRAEWHGFPLAKRLQDELGAPAVVLNDAALAGLGEARYGAGKDSKILAYITVSTGVGGARIVDGAIDRATYGFEMGHHQVAPGRTFHDISGPAVKERFGVEAKDLVDEKAKATLVSELLTGLYNTTLFWSPDTIVLGGAMILGTNPITIDGVEAELTKRLVDDYPTGPVIKKAALGDNSGLYGAMAYLSKG
jgi:glucokinase